LISSAIRASRDSRLARFAPRAIRASRYSRLARFEPPKNKKNREFIRRPTEPHFCVPPGDAAIAACQARVRDALKLTQ